ncbi:cytochrome c [Chimaeribacter arupi]|uniref:cytochrome c n=1 Tax=Chimaeribacter arupi TaxID=2060066 RepID=UPI00294538E8|nr:cytochrome c [Chimaeribacter arupi]MDV5141468.1 cytochrome c [Chimaeribacter arupi]
MKTLLSLCIGLSLLAAGNSEAAGDGSFETVDKGRYLAVLGDCAACHTAKADQPYAGGVPIETPFGRLVGANITPDRETGIGTWTFEEFDRAMSEGIGKGGVHLYGAMPFTAFTRVTREDNRALWAYLQTLQPIHSDVKTNQLPFPFNQRASLIGWNWLNFDKGEYRPRLDKSAQWNRGAYLVEGLGHCGTCHTPKNLIGGDKTSQTLQGAVVQEWMAPDITPDPHTGIGRWTEQELMDYLKTGANRYDIASGPMAEEVDHSSRHWTEEDLRAVAVYLKQSGLSSHTATVPAPLKPDDARMVAGRAVYADRCSACHTPDGQGIPGLFPRLADAPLVNSVNATSMIRVVLAGSRAGATTAVPTAPSMPSFDRYLSDQDIANVLTYVRNSWNNAAAPVAPDDVRDLREPLRR